MFLKNTYTLLLTVYLLVLLIACSDSSNNSEDEIVLVPFEADERLFSSPYHIDDCFDNLGNLTADAYIYRCSDESALGCSGISNDFEGSSTDPISSIKITENINGVYSFEVEIHEFGNYSASLTCQAHLDNPTGDDDIEFIRSIDFIPSSYYFRVGEIPEDFDGGELPDPHFSTTSDCLECHNVSDTYDVAVINHHYLQPGFCLECHSPARNNNS